MSVINVAVPKAKGENLEFDGDKPSQEVFAIIVQLGVAVLLGKGMSKITKANYPDPEEYKAAALAQAQENLEAIYSGEILAKVRVAGSKKVTKVAGAVMNEARKRAREIIKNALRAQGLKVSHYKSAAITQYANQYLDTEEGAITIEESKLYLEERDAKKPKLTGIDITAMKPDAKLVAAANEKKAKTKKMPAGVVNVKGRQSGATSRTN